MVRIIQPLLSESEAAALAKVLEYLETEREDFLAADPEDRARHIYQHVLTLGQLLQRPRFDLGRIMLTPGADEALKSSGQEAWKFLARHASGDWGEVPPEDWEENELSLMRELRLLSAYRTGKGERLWVITEADRSVTTLLLPEEY